MYPILANEALIKTFLTSIQNDRLAGCYLLEGAEGTGKLTIARYIAAALVCTRKKSDGAPCLTCPACKNALSGNHVDVIELRPEEEGKQITVDAVRGMLQSTHVLPSEGDWRVFILEESDKMRKEAQNALLKSIEEPRPQTVFFLLACDKSKLLPTVRSRAVKVSTEPLPPSILRTALSDEIVPTSRLEEVILLSGGSMGKAKKLLEDTEYFTIREKVTSYFKAILDGASFTKLCLIFPPDKMTRKDLLPILPMIKSALRDLLCVRFDEENCPEWFTDRTLLFDLASIISPSAASSLFEICQNLEGALAQNANIFAALSGFHLTAKKLTQAE